MCTKSLSNTSSVPRPAASTAAARRKAKILLLQLKPYNEWMAGISDHTLQSVQRVFGDSRLFYNDVVRNLRRLAGL